ncbi:MAG: hypothetical protein V3V08_14365 [Nannocystaceae bacterium]
MAGKHACLYASDDPYFRAMNRWGQDATNGALGDFCVRCHAPIALDEGETQDGLNLDEIPTYLRGVTCYYCHTVTAVEGAHNNQLARTDDVIMRGSVLHPAETDSHSSAHSPLHDGRDLRSSALCGSYHDVITPSGVALERSFVEWSDSFYAHQNPSQTGPALYSQRCNSCHMPGSDDAIADAEGVLPNRRRHDHSMPGPGVVVTAFPDHPEAEEIRSEHMRTTEAFRRAALCGTVCVNAIPSAAPDLPDTVEVAVWLHNETAGHSWPSGAAQDRRAWVELVAYAGQEVVYENGRLTDDMAVGTHDDESLWGFGDRVFDAADQRVHAHWQITRYETGSLPVGTRIGGDAETWIPRTYAYAGSLPDRVELRMKLRPMPRDLLDDLVIRGYLDAAAASAMPTFDIAGVHLDWTSATAEATETAGSCVSSSPSCRAPIPWGT